MVNPALVRDALVSTPRKSSNFGSAPLRRRMRSTSLCVLLACALVLSLGACSSKKTSRASAAKNAKDQTPASKRADEQADFDRKIAAEQDALAKQAEDEEVAKQKQADNSKLPAEFGTVATLQGTGRAGPIQADGAPVVAVAPVNVPQPIPPVQVQGAVPYDKAFPPLQDNTVRVGIMSGASQAGDGRSLARMLAYEDRKYLEETLGLGIKVAFVSETDRPETHRSRVQYRVPFLKAAVHIAALMPQPQQIEILSDAEAAKQGVDVLVQIGTDLR